MTATVQTGLDRLVAERFQRLRGRRVGVIANPTAVDSQLRHLADLLHQAPDVWLVSLFGPEHGIRGDAQDMIGVGEEVDPATGVPAFSLYGEAVKSLRPTDAQLDELDVLIFDVQDVGSRYYTFAATMIYAMEAASRANTAFVVLDRPNPIGGVAVQGPTVDPGFESFVGAYPMPIRHGLTVGEIARMAREELRLDLDLEVIACEGWNRAMHWPDTGLPWVMPSPNMPSYETALVYPGGCLIEGTNLSEGRGTTRPFELWGAPWLGAWSRANQAAPAGVRLRPSVFRPMFHKHRGEVCHGIQPHVINRETFHPIESYLRMIASSRTADPERFAWRTEPYEFVKDPIAIDLLLGSSEIRQAIESGHAFDGDGDLATFDHQDVAEFLSRREPFLLYR